MNVWKNSSALISHSIIIFVYFGNGVTLYEDLTLYFWLPIESQYQFAYSCMPHICVLKGSCILWNSSEH